MTVLKIGVWAFALAGLIAWDAAAAAMPSSRGDELQHPKPTPTARSRGGGEQPYGREGDPRKVKRVIRIDLSDAMRFFPDQIRVKRGDTVRFVLRNSGALPHAMVIGTMDELKTKAVLAKKTVEAGEPQRYAMHVTPGATERLVWQFTKPGEFYYACLMPGHFDAGMIGTIVVR
jgi:uncharacterized cupredoxin-like copper-binding protein